MRLTLFLKDIKSELPCINSAFTPKIKGLYRVE